MLMIAQQTIGKDLAPPKGPGFAQHLEKGGIISGSTKGRPASQPTAHHMIDRVGILNTQGPSHMSNATQANETLNKRLAPSDCDWIAIEERIFYAEIIHHRHLVAGSHDEEHRMNMRV